MPEPEFNKNGYPTESTLETIRNWEIIQQGKSIEKVTEELLSFICEAWKYEDRAQNVRPGVWTFSTGGWSGNEELLSAFFESTVWRVMQHRSIQLTGGFLVITTTEEAELELSELEHKIVEWAWKNQT